MKPIPKYLRWVAFGVGLVMFALAIAMYIGMTRVVVGEHQENVQWLPLNAKDASFYRSYDYTAFEFNIGEQDFLTWAKSNAWETKPLDKPTVIGRYTAGPKFQRKPGDPTEHTAAKGHIYEKLREGSTDEGVRVVYDSEAGRAFFTWKPSQ